MGSEVGAHVRRVGKPGLRKHAVSIARGVTISMLFVFLWAAMPQRAYAHPDLDRAIRLSGELEFTSALRAFQKALDSKTLTKAELSTLLAERALMLHALRRQAEVVADFRSLAAIDPARKLDRRAPPDLTAIWESLRNEAGGGRAEVELRNESEPGVLRLRALIHGARPPELRLEAYFRLDSGPFERLADVGGVERSVPAGADVQTYAQLSGLGEVVLAVSGSAEQPLVFRVPSEEEARAAILVAGGKDKSEHKYRKWYWIGGAVVLVAAVVVTSALLVDSSEPTSVNIKPMVNF